MFFRRSTALLTALCFTFQASGIQAGEVNGDPSSVISNNPNLLDYYPPSSLAKVTDSYQASSSTSPLVINIQDLHAHPGVQKEISQLLAYYTSQGIATQFVAVEGAEGLVDTTLMALFPDEEIKKEVTDEFVSQGLFTGMEDYAIRNKKTSYLYGVDDRETYRLHKAFFQKSLENRSKLSQEIQDLQSRLKALEPTIYSPSMKALKAKERSYQEGKLSLGKYLKHLKSKSQVYPEELAAMETTLDLEQDLPKEKTLQAQTRTFLTTLHSSLSHEEQDRLAKFAKEDSTLYYLYLNHLANQHQALNFCPQGLKSYLTQNARLQNQNLQSFQTQLEETTFNLLLRQAKTKTQKNLVTVQRDLALVQDLVQLKLTEDQLKNILPRTSGLLAMLESLLSHEPSNQRTIEPSFLKELLTQAIDFYALALTRDKPLIEKTLEHLSIPSPLRGEGQGEGDVAILVTGGFHSPGIARLLKEKRISYLTLSPNVESYSEQDQERYIKLLTGKTPAGIGSGSQDSLALGVWPEELGFKTAAQRLIAKHAGEDPKEMEESLTKAFTESYPKESRPEVRVKGNQATVTLPTVEKDTIIIPIESREETPLRDIPAPFENQVNIVKPNIEVHPSSMQRLTSVMQRGAVVAIAAFFLITFFQYSTGDSTVLGNLGSSVLFAMAMIPGGEWRGDDLPSLKRQIIAEVRTLANIQEEIEDGVETLQEVTLSSFINSPFPHPEAGGSAHKDKAIEKLKELIGVIPDINAWRTEFAQFFHELDLNHLEEGLNMITERDELLAMLRSIKEKSAKAHGILETMRRSDHDLLSLKDTPNEGEGGTSSPVTPLLDFKVLSHEELEVALGLLRKTLEQGRDFFDRLTVMEKLHTYNLAGLLGLSQHFKSTGIDEDEFSYDAAQWLRSPSPREIPDLPTRGYEVSDGKVWTRLHTEDYRNILSQPGLAVKNDNAAVLSLCGGNGQALTRLAPLFNNSRLVLADANFQNVLSAIHLFKGIKDTNNYEIKLTDIRKKFGGIPYPDGTFDLIAFVGDSDYGFSPDDMPRLLEELMRVTNKQHGRIIIETDKFHKFTAALSQIPNPGSFKVHKIGRTVYVLAFGNGSSTEGQGTPNPVSGFNNFTSMLMTVVLLAIGVAIVAYGFGGRDLMAMAGLGTAFRTAPIAMRKEEFAFPRNVVSYMIENYETQLKDALAGRPSSLMRLKMNLPLPTGKEKKGRYVVVQWGGTFVTLDEIGLSAGGEIISNPVTIPVTAKEKRYPQLFCKKIARAVKEKYRAADPSEEIAVIFSFAVTDEGEVVELDKGWGGPKGDELNGQNIVTLMNESLAEAGIPNVKVGVLFNDSANALFVYQWQKLSQGEDPGLVFISHVGGTGTNDLILVDGELINTESGGYDFGPYLSFITTEEDKQIDAMAPEGRQLLEKRSSGGYLGELVRRRLAAIGRTSSAFHWQAVPAFSQEGEFKSEYLGRITQGHLEIQKLLRELSWDRSWIKPLKFLRKIPVIGPALDRCVEIESTPEERTALQEISSAVVERSAHIMAMKFTAMTHVLAPKAHSRIVIPAEGGLYKYPGYRDMVLKAVGEFDPALKDKLDIVIVKKPGAGAAVALAKKREGIGVSHLAILFWAGLAAALLGLMGGGDHGLWAIAPPSGGSDKGKGSGPKVDGKTLPLIVLTTVLGFLLATSWNSQLSTLQALSMVSLGLGVLGYILLIYVDVNSRNHQKWRAQSAEFVKEIGANREALIQVIADLKLMVNFALISGRSVVHLHDVKRCFERVHDPNAELLYSFITRMAHKGLIDVEQLEAVLRDFENPPNPTLKKDKVEGSGSENFLAILAWLGLSVLLGLSGTGGHNLLAAGPLLATGGQEKGGLPPGRLVFMTELGDLVLGPVREHPIDLDWLDLDAKEMRKAGIKVRGKELIRIQHPSNPETRFRVKILKQRQLKKLQERNAGIKTVSIERIVGTLERRDATLLAALLGDRITKDFGNPDQREALAKEFYHLFQMLPSMRKPLFINSPLLEDIFQGFVFLFAAVILIGGVFGVFDFVFRHTHKGDHIADIFRFGGVLVVTLMVVSVVLKLLFDICKAILSREEMWKLESGFVAGKDGKNIQKLLMESGYSETPELFRRVKDELCQGKLSIGARALFFQKFKNELMGKPSVDVLFHNGSHWRTHLNRLEALDRSLGLTTAGVELHLEASAAEKRSALQKVAHSFSDHVQPHALAPIESRGADTDLRLLPAYPAVFRKLTSEFLGDPAFDLYKNVGAHYCLDLDLRENLVPISLALFFGDPVYAWLPHPRGDMPTGFPGVHTYRGITLNPYLGFTTVRTQSNLHIRPLRVLQNAGEFVELKDFFPKDLENLAWLASAANSSSSKPFSFFLKAWDDWLFSLNQPGLSGAMSGAKIAIQDQRGAGVNDALDHATAGLFYALYGAFLPQVISINEFRLSPEVRQRSREKRAELARIVEQTVEMIQEEQIPNVEARAAILAYRQAETLEDLDRTYAEAVQVLTQQYFSTERDSRESTRLLELLEALNPAKASQIRAATTKKSFLQRLWSRLASRNSLIVLALLSALGFVLGTDLNFDTTALSVGTAVASAGQPLFLDLTGYRQVGQVGPHDFPVYEKGEHKVLIKNRPDALWFYPFIERLAWEVAQKAGIETAPAWFVPTTSKTLFTALEFWEGSEALRNDYARHTSSLAKEHPELLNVRPTAVDYKAWSPHLADPAQFIQSDLLRQFMSVGDSSTPNQVLIRKARTGKGGETLYEARFIDFEAGLVNKTLPPSELELFLKKDSAWLESYALPQLERLGGMTDQEIQEMVMNIFSDERRDVVPSYQAHYGYESVRQKVITGLMASRDVVEQALPDIRAQVDSQESQNDSASPSVRLDKLYEAVKGCDFSTVPDVGDFREEMKADVRHSYELAQELLKHDVRKVMVVGDSMISLPFYLSALGIDVVFLDMGKDKFKIPMFMAQMLKAEAKSKGLAIVADFRCIHSEIGSLGLARHGLTPHSFDVVTMADLDGGDPKGEPVRWLKTCEKLLKKDGLLLLDDPGVPGFEQARAKEFWGFVSRIFPSHYLVTDKLFTGTYNFTTQQKMKQAFDDDVPAATNVLISVGYRRIPEPPRPGSPMVLSFILLAVIVAQMIIIVLYHWPQIAEFFKTLLQVLGLSSFSSPAIDHSLVDAITHLDPPGPKGPGPGFDRTELSQAMMTLLPTVSKEKASELRNMHSGLQALMAPSRAG